MGRRGGNAAPVAVGRHSLGVLGEYRIVHLEAGGGAKRPLVSCETVRIELGTY